jgi:crotonobetainyl-CoA:carnitine CoA-transferase CaiB-like acyl-CoA transferase
MICHLTGYEGGDPLFTGTTCGDPLAGLMGGLALLAGLHHRRLTGEGQHIDLSQVEAATSFLGDVLVEAQLTGTDPTRHGNRNPVMAPHGTYPCRDDRWIAIACRTDDQWRALWRAMSGDDAAAGTPPYPTLDERLLNVARLDEWLAAWTQDQDADELMHRLQAKGVPAAAVMNGVHMLADAHLQARGFFIPQERDEVGIKHHLAQAFRLADAALPEARRAPYLGEYNREILCGLLGVTDDEYGALERDAVIGTAPI